MPPRDDYSIYCDLSSAVGEHKSDLQDEIDQAAESSGLLRTVNALDPSKNRIDKVNVKKFLSDFDHTFMDRSKPKGPSYFIIDNFSHYFKLERADLLGARDEAEQLANHVCSGGEAAEYARCDVLHWLKTLDTNGFGMPYFEKIAKTMAAFRAKLNTRSQSTSGDKTMRVDKEETILTRHNGASEREQTYRRHKDTYIHDKNNEIHGMELRKLTMVIFLNDNIDQVDSSPDAGKGMLRLYPNGERMQGIVDISPRLGRAVLFKSEEMIH